MKLAIFAIIVASASAWAPQLRKFDFAQCAKAGAAAAAISIATAGPVLAADVGAGEQVFNANCAACHAGGQNVIMPEKTLEKEALDQYLAGGRKESSVITQVTNGKNAMPAFGGRLGDDDIANVAAYVIATSESGWE
mmetsp:Transcript_11254/g.16194  ORF Transcript_11254/g.16194 Transcript_11254/m.16194 type:complete len:137 (+) Transcript_11254:91-501(+)|eukprot:CAMPEP_0172422808 /NCGR_PEP_ID=MMETSP1064-20121228/8923_1 /TAXON_ID=202472 /ORGANISM="Aulacoseira subarctica , Strain CCAP 1002/5" /LENGTH=136 /DNA_ID=CAMNT_0013163855 /DNA_START=91 /DNA_END=501 /DNA_ORIENTATION=-